MYTWDDRARAQSEKSQSLTLRPENTAGVVRAYIEHKLGESGRCRSSTTSARSSAGSVRRKGVIGNFGKSALKSSARQRGFRITAARCRSPRNALEFLDELGISGWTLVLNSVGSSADRPKYVAALREALAPVKDKMSADNQRRAETNPSPRPRLEGPRRPAHHRHPAQNRRLP